MRRNITDDFTHGQTAFPFDFDGDGDLDIIASYSLTDSVYLLMNPGDDETPWTRILIVADFVATRAVPFDGNCDGVVDIAATELFDRADGFESTGRIAWYQRPSPITGTWTEQVIESSVIHPYHIVAGDIDGDGDDDLAAVSNSASVANSVFWYENRCGATSGPRWQRYVVATGANFGSPGSVQLARIDGDASLDIVVADKGNGRVVWYENGGTPRRDSWPMRTMRSDIAGPEAARPYDLDADGDLDVIVAFRGANRVAWLEHPADPTTTWPVRDVSTSFVDPRDVTVADLNADGRLDVVAMSGDSAFGGIDTLAIFEKNAGAGYTRRLEDENYYSGSYVMPGDIDGDGDTDLATGSYNGNSMDWWENVHETGAVTLQPPANVVATANNSGQVNVTWSAVTGAVSYDVWRSSGGAAFVKIDSTATTGFVNSNLAADTTYLFKVRSVGTDSSSALSAADLATTTVFTDDPLIARSTTVKAVHLSQARVAVNAVRAAANLGAYPFTGTAAAGLTVRSLQIQQLRTALNEARGIIGVPAMSWTNPATVGTTVRALDMTEIRNGVK